MKLIPLTRVGGVRGLGWEEASGSLAEKSPVVGSESMWWPPDSLSDPVPRQTLSWHIPGKWSLAHLLCVLGPVTSPR